MDRKREALNDSLSSLRTRLRSLQTLVGKAWCARTSPRSELWCTFRTGASPEPSGWQNRSTFSPMPLHNRSYLSPERPDADFLYSQLLAERRLSSELRSRLDAQPRAASREPRLQSYSTSPTLAMPSQSSPTHTMVECQALNVSSLALCVRLEPGAH